MAAINSSLGKKVIMALTGLFLCSFLLVHLIGNFQLLKSDGGEAFNFYAKFMTTNPVIKITSYLLYASIIGHAIYGLILTLNNKKARPQGYVSFNNKSAWNSRNMGILGTIMLAFIVVHMSDFWWEYHNGALPLYTLKDGTVVKDLFKEVYESFESPFVVILYVLAQVAIGFHLAHGFQSAFQTVGFNHSKYTPTIKKIGLAFSILVPAGFAAIPIWIFLIQK